jgi:hypothetical protein
MDEFSSDQAYFHLKNIDFLVENGALMEFDVLSYGGRNVIYPPVFHVVMGLSSGDYDVLKFLPEFFMALLVVVVFFLAKEISGSSLAALISALLSGFVPLLITETMNQISVYSLVLPLLFFLLYCFLKLDQDVFLYLYLFGVFVFGLLHSSVFLLLLCLMFYMLVMYSEKVKVIKLQKEAFWYTFFMVFLLQFIMYKKAFFDYGFDMIWQNIPSNILFDLYKPLTGLGLVFAVGFIPLIFGVLGLWRGIFKVRSSGVYLISSFILALFLLLAFRFLQFNVGLMILGVALAVVSAIGVEFLMEKVKNTKFSGWVFVVFIVVVVLVVVPGYNVMKGVEDVDDEVIGVLHLLSENSEEDAIVLGNVYEGNIINHFAKRGNAVDSNFVLAKKPVQRMENVQTIYTTYSQAKALELLRRYRVDYVYLSPQTKEAYGVEKLNYIVSWRCVDWVSEGLYEIKC